MLSQHKANNMYRIYGNESVKTIKDIRTQNQYAHITSILIDYSSSNQNDSM